MPPTMPRVSQTHHYLPAKVLLPVMLIMLTSIMWIDTESSSTRIRVLTVLVTAAALIMQLLALRGGALYLRVTKFLKRLRSRAILLWLLVLLVLTTTLFIWIIEGNPSVYQTIGAAELYYLLGGLWGISVLLGYGTDLAELQALGRQIAHNSATRLLLLLSVSIVLIFGAELWIRFVTLNDDGVAIVLGVGWFERYWNPTNALGYRDHAPEADLPDQVQRILIVGDSFVAGQGIRSIEDTFPHILAEDLGPSYTTNIVANNGWHTATQLASLVRYPVTPDIIVLSYILNDIDAVASANYAGDPIRYSVPRTGLDGWLYEHSMLYRYVFWRYATSSASGISTAYGNYLATSYSDPTILAAQTALLNEFILFAEDQGAQLIVLLWPYGGSTWEYELLLPIRDFFVAQGVEVVDLYQTFEGTLPVEMKIAWDGHPNIRAHQRVSEALAAVIMR